MKRIYTACLVLILCTAIAGNLHAQTSNSVLGNILERIFPHSPQAQSLTFQNDTIRKSVKLNNVWTLSRIFAKEYDNQSQLTDIYEYSIGTMGGLNPLNRWEFAYNASGLLTQSLQSRRQGSSWVGEELTLFSYNSQGFTTQELYKVFNGSSWDNSEKIEYSYDTLGRVTEKTILLSISGNWEYTEKLEYSYSTGINRIEALHKIWTVNGWADSLKIVTTFDWTGSLLDEYVYLWANNAWENKSMIFFSLNANNQLTERLEYYWNGSTWKNYSRDMHTYDIHDLLTGSEHQSWVLNAWQGEEKLEYSYFDPNATGLAEILSGSLTVYPNPCSESAMFKAPDPQFFNDATVRVFDMSGRMIRQESLGSDSQEYQLYRDKLPSGTYLVSIVSENGIKANQRLIIHD